MGEGEILYIIYNRTLMKQVDHSETAVAKLQRSDGNEDWI
jgi:hypothetical protein